MNGSWRSLSRACGLKFDREAIRVACGNGRFQEVRIDESSPEMIRLWSRVASRSQLDVDRLELERPEVEAWLVNRYRELVGFKVTERGTVIGEAWIPMIDVSPEEWSLYVHTLAKACDRLEYLWTGSDQE